VAGMDLSLKPQVLITTLEEPELRVAAKKWGRG
jgi:hypothetical protein